MRPNTWLPYGFALLLPVTGVMGACGPAVETLTTGGGGSATTMNTGGSTSITTSSTSSTGGGGTGGSTGGTGGVGATGGTGTGGFMAPANDVCGGAEKIPVTVDAPPTSVDGTLNGATDDYQTFCSDMTPEPDFADVVYQLDIPSDVTATITVTGTGFNPALSLHKSDCNSRFNGDACLLGSNGTVQTKVALAPGQAWLIIESGDGQTGNFTVTVEFASPKCGDSVVNPGENCDPAMPSGDDGCFNPGAAGECKFGEPPPDPAIVQCPGGLITIGKGDSFQLGLYNNGAGGLNHQNVTDAVDCVSPAVGPENVFNVKPTGDGVLQAQIGHDVDGTTLYCTTYPNDCADFIMYVRKNACNSAIAADQLACTDYTPNNIPPYFYDELLTINIPVTGGQDYWLFVDGLDDMYGKGGYYVELSLQ